tara:strand:- start:2205 stop:2750 length:546 start_codon:yes stop_codon:yes gene_type:complete
MSFLPDNYEAPASSGGNYTKLAQGKNTFRIIGDSTKGTAIFGWIGWTEEDGKRKPVRTKEKPPAGVYADKPKHFWAFLVLNEGTVQICEITQRGIQDALRELLNDPDWGDLKQYDICIQREGEGMETSYTVIPKPKAPLSEADVATIKEKLPLINMAALYQGEDPFAATKSDDSDASADPF